MKIAKQEVQAVADLKVGYILGHADVAILNELVRIALASLEAEPVAWTSEQSLAEVCCDETGMIGPHTWWEISRSIFTPSMRM